MVRRIGFGGQVALITLAGALLRAVCIARQPLWRDEAFTALAVQHTLQSMLDIVSRDSAPPLAYILNHYVATFLSAQPAALRLVSLMAGTMMVPLGALLGRRVAGNRAGIFAAIACAILPSLVVSSRDARMYALASMLTMASVLAVWRFLESPGLRRWLVFTLLMTAGLLTDYFFAFAMIAIFIATALAYRPPLRVTVRIALGNIVAGLLLVPWLIRAKAQFSHAGTPFWVEPVGGKTISGTLVQFFSGPPIEPETPFKILLQVFQGGAVVAGALLLVVLAVHRHRLTLEQRYSALFLAIAGSTGTLLLAAISVWHPLLEARYASVTWGPLIVLIGVGATLVRHDVSRYATAAAGLLATLALSAAVTQPNTPATVAYLDAHLNGGSVVAAPSEYLLLRYYGDERLRQATHVIATDLPWFWGTAVYPPDAVQPSLPATTLATRRPVLVVAGVGDPPPITTPPGYRQAGVWCVARTCVTTFAPG